jgi:hypothetical protein
MKSGLTSLAALGFFEAGFADRVVAQGLAQVFPNVVDRQSARLALRNDQEQARQLIDPYPAYFTAVLQELVT